MSIFSQLPNDLIMRIIRESDGGIHTHKVKSKEVFDSIKGVGKEYGVHEMEEMMKVMTGEIFYLPNFIEEDQFFCGLYHRGDLTDTISQYRRNGHK